jgi:transposase
MDKKTTPESVVREIKRKTRRKFSAEEKIRIVLEGLRGEESIKTLCRKEGINPNLYYRWSKEFLEAGKKRLLGDTEREATSSEVDAYRKENEQLKQLVAELALKNRVLNRPWRSLISVAAPFMTGIDDISRTVMMDWPTEYQLPDGSGTRSRNQSGTRSSILLLMKRRNLPESWHGISPIRMRISYQNRASIAF